MLLFGGAFRFVDHNLAPNWTQRHSKVVHDHQKSPKGGPGERKCLQVAPKGWPSTPKRDQNVPKCNKALRKCFQWQPSKAPRDPKKRDYTCAADVVPEAAFATPVQRIYDTYAAECVCEKQHLRHLCSGFGAQSSICDTGAADVVPEADMCLFFFLVTQKSWVVVWWSIKGLSKSRVWLVCGPNWVVAQITWLCGYALLLLSATVRNHVLLGSMPLAVSL